MRKKLALTTLEVQGNVVNTTSVSLVVDSGPGTKRIKISSVYTKEKINIQGIHMATEEDLVGLTFLEGIDVPFVTEQEVGLLIG